MVNYNYSHKKFKKYIKKIGLSYLRRVRGYKLKYILRHESQIIEHRGIDNNWMRIGKEITEVLEHKPGEFWGQTYHTPQV